MVGFDVDKILKKYREFLSDVSDVDYLQGGEAQKGFGDITEMFNDSITLETSCGIIEGRAKVRDVFGSRVTVMKADNGDGKENVRMVVTAPLVTKEQIEMLRKKEVYLADFDYTVDVGFTSSRSEMLDFLSHDVDWNTYRVADRESRVGRYCLSWLGYDENGNKVRYKIYNKLVELVESKGVRVVLGSSMYEFMGNDPITKTMMLFRDVGMMRIEVTFYGEDLQSQDFYRRHVMKLYDSFAGCRTYKISLKQQWENMTTKITQVLMLYDVESRAFAYCHWWNSVTHKMQGGTRILNKIEDVNKVMGNFSFYDIPIRLITINGRDEKVELYMRDHGGSIYTLVPGPRGGFYPSNPDHELVDYGIGHVTTGMIGWPRGFSYQSKMLAGVTAQLPEQEDDVDELIRAMTCLTIVSRDCRPGYIVLVPGREYEVQGVGRVMFRGKEYICCKMATGEQVRCGNSLSSILEGESSVIKIRALRITTTGGSRDMACERILS